MNFNEYQILSRRTQKEGETREEALIHSQLGASSEVGELADAIKKNFAYGLPLDRGNVHEELGDILWYVSLGCDSIGVSMEDVAKSNIDKLKKRYPNKFSMEAAVARLDKAE